MRIACLTSEIGLGGGETSLLNLLAGLRNRGIAVELLCPPGPLARTAADRGIETTPVTLSAVQLRWGLVPTFSVNAVLELAGIIRRHHVSILHAESLLALFYGGIASRLTGIPCVATYHGYWPQKRMTGILLRACCRRLYPVSETVRPELTQLVSPSASSVPHSAFRIPHSEAVPIRVVPLDISPAFTASLPVREAARRLTGLPARARIVMQVARFQEIKGQRLLLDAMRLVVHDPAAAIREPLVLVFVGGLTDPATSRDRAYWESLQAEGQQTNGPETGDGRLVSGPRSSVPGRHPTPDTRPLQVRFLDHRPDVPLLMRAADLIVIPSLFETFGMVVPEAATVGTPIIATEVGGLAEILRHGDTALLVPPDNPRALADAILESLTRPLAAAERARRAKAVVAPCYAPGTRASRLLAEYAELTSSTKPRALRSSHPNYSSDSSQEGAPCVS